MKTLLITAITGIVLAAQAAELNVWSGIPPLVSTLRAVGSDRVQVSSLMDGSKDPHTWTPSPKAVAAVRDADLFFTVGMPFEQTVAEKLAAMNSGLQVIDASVGLDIAGDPHVWLSIPILSKIAETAAQALSRADPSGESVYQQNCAAYQRTLAAQHAQLQQKMDSLKGQAFFVYHPVFGYFAKDYGLKQGVVELEGKSPSPKDLLGLVSQARAEKVRVVFVQPQFNQRPAKIIASQIGGTVVPINPLSENPVMVIEEAASVLVNIYADKP